MKTKVTNGMIRQAQDRVEYLKEECLRQHGWERKLVGALWLWHFKTKEGQDIYVDTRSAYHLVEMGNYQ